MQSIGTADQEAREDLFYGQIVIIVARWFLIAAGVVLALWSANSIEDIQGPITFMVLLMGVNFFIHGRYMMSQPLNATLVYVSVIADLLVITGIVLVGSPSLGRGLANPFFIFLYPDLLALGLVFQGRMSLRFSGIALLVYAVVAIAVSPSSPVLPGDPIRNFDDTKDLLRRLVTLATTAGLGTYYWRIQRGRRRDIVTSRAALLEGVERLTAQPGAR